MRSPLLLLLLIYSACSCLGSEPVQLGWDFQEGEQLTFVVRDEQRKKSGLSALAVPIDAIVETTVTWKVASIDENGTATIRTKLDRMKMTIIPTPGEKVYLDSANTKSPPPHLAHVLETMRQDTSEEFEIVLSSQCNLREIRSPSKSPVRRGWIEVLKCVLIPMPESPVSEGDTWSTKTNIDMGDGSTRRLELGYKYLGTQETEDGLQHVIIYAARASRPKVQKTLTLREFHDISKGRLFFDADEHRLRKISTESNSKLRLGKNTTSLEIINELRQVVKVDISITGASTKTRNVSRVTD